MKTLTLDGSSLSLEDLSPLVAGEDLQLAIDPAVEEGIHASRAMVDAHVAAGDVVYGLTTGFGKLKNVAVPREDLAELQRNLVLSHCVGVGDPMPEREVRIAQVLRLNSLLRGVSGVRLSLVHHLRDVFNAGFVPVVPQQGSVGASGDLAPLSHMVAAMMGAAGLGGAVWTRRGSPDAGLAPLELEAKEGLALISGTEIMKASGVVSVLRLQPSRPRMRSPPSPSRPSRGASPFPGPACSAEEQRGSAAPRQRARLPRALRGPLSHEDCDRVQDPYSCAASRRSTVRSRRPSPTSRPCCPRSSTRSRTTRSSCRRPGRSSARVSSTASRCR